MERSEREGARLEQETNGRRRKKRTAEAKAEEVHEVQQEEVEVVEEEKRESRRGKRPDKRSSPKAPAPRRQIHTAKLQQVNDADRKSPPAHVSEVDGDAWEVAGDGPQPSASTSRSHVTGVRQSSKPQSPAGSVSVRHPGASSQLQAAVSPRKSKDQERRKSVGIEGEKEEEFYGDNIRVRLPWEVIESPVEDEGPEVETVVDPAVELEVELEREPDVELGPELESEITVQDDDPQAGQDLPEVTTEAEEANTSQEAIWVDGGAAEQEGDAAEPPTPPLSPVALRAHGKKRLKETIPVEQAKERGHYVTATSATPTPLWRTSRRTSFSAPRRPSDWRNPSEQAEEVAWNALPLSPALSSPPSNVSRRAFFVVESLATADPMTFAQKLRRTKSALPRKKRDDCWSKMTELDSMFRNVNYYYPEGSSPVYPPTTPLTWRAELRKDKRPSLPQTDTPSRKSPEFEIPPLESGMISPISPLRILDDAPLPIPEPSSPLPPQRSSVRPRPKDDDGINNFGADDGGCGGIVSGDENIALYAPIPGNPLQIGSAAFIPSTEALPTVFPGPKPPPLETPLSPPETPCQICQAPHLNARWTYNPCGHNACRWCWYTAWEISQVRSCPTTKYMAVPCGICKEDVVELLAVGAEEKWNAVGEVVRPRTSAASVRRRYRRNSYGTP